MNPIRRSTAALLLALLYACGTSAISSGEEPQQEPDPQQNSFALWLGRQTNVSRPFLSWGPSDPRDFVASDYDLIDDRWKENGGQIDLQVIRGSKVKLPETPNGYTTLVNGEVSTLFFMTKVPLPRYEEGELPLERRIPPQPTGVKLPIRKDSLYIVGITRLGESTLQGGYSLNVRIKEGPLAGAIVYLRDYEHPESVGDPFVAIYKIPDDLEVPEGPLSFKVVHISSK
ncbi:hypothetical protein [Aeoliella mucimassa]|nr:hypothetical protein [Aeoliella mucimassa]